MISQDVVLLVIKKLWNMGTYYSYCLNARFYLNLELFLEFVNSTK